MSHPITPTGRTPLQRYLTQLDNQVYQIKVNHTWSLPYYYKKLDDMINQSLTYEREGSDELAYINYRRSASLFLNTIAEHKQFNTVAQADKQRYKKLVTECMARMNMLRGKLVEQFEAKQADRQKQAATAAAAAAATNPPPAPQPTEPQRTATITPQSAEQAAVAPEPPSVQHQQFQAQPPALDATLLSRLTALGIDDNASRPTTPQQSLPSGPPAPSQQPYSTLDEASIQRLQRLGITPLTDAGAAGHQRVDSATNARLQALGIAAADSISTTPADQNSKLAALGITPVDHDETPDNRKTDTVNDDSKAGEYIPPPPPPPPEGEVMSPPPFKPDTTPFDNTPVTYPSLDGNKKSQSPANKNAGNNSAGVLRKTHIPSDILIEFDRLAAPNTRQNKETCGILCGKLQRNELYVTHCIVPAQQGTANQCTTENEEDVFNIQIQHDLITLGWIHTHPTQTAFLSSIDVHTQYGYQVMMHEAVAVVLAPTSKPNYGVYAISDSGMSVVAHCTHGSTFHTHDDVKLFYDVKHVMWDNNTKCQFIDLR